MDPQDLLTDLLTGEFSQKHADIKSNTENKKGTVRTQVLCSVFFPLFDIPFPEAAGSRKSGHKEEADVGGQDKHQGEED